MIFRVLVLILMSVTHSLSGLEVDIPEKTPPLGVQSITTSISKNKAEKTLSSVVYFDPQRRKEEKQVFTQDGELRWTVTYRYNERGKIEEEKAIDTDDNQVWRIQYNYDSQGKLLQETHYNKNDSPDYMLVNEYQDERTETLAYGAEGALRWRRKTIEEEGVREIFYYYPDGNRIKGIIKEFNDKDQLFKETHIDEIGAIFRRIETKYDIHDRITERTVFNHKDEIHREVFITYLLSGHPAHIRQIFPQENREEELLYEYRFDNRGAWTYRETMVVVKGGDTDEKVTISHTIEYRNIEYYQFNIDDIGATR